MLEFENKMRLQTKPESELIDFFFGGGGGGEMHILNLNLFKNYKKVSTQVGEKI